MWYICVGGEGLSLSLMPSFADTHESAKIQGRPMQYCIIPLQLKCNSIDQLEYSPHAHTQKAAPPTIFRLCSRSNKAGFHPRTSFSPTNTSRAHPPGQDVDPPKREQTPKDLLILYYRLRAHLLAWHSRPRRANPPLLRGDRHSLHRCRQPDQRRHQSRHLAHRSFKHRRRRQPASLSAADTSPRRTTHRSIAQHPTLSWSTAWFST